MDEEREAIQAFLLAAMRVAFTTLPDDATDMIGLAATQAIGEYAGQLEEQQTVEQQPGEWRTHNVDGYHFSIRRTDSGHLEIQNEDI